MIRNFIAAAVLSVVLAGCGGFVGGVAGVLTSNNQDAVKLLTQIGDTAIPDLQTQRDVALAATPPDVHAAACAGTLPDPTKPIDTNTNAGTGALSVAAAIQRVAAATTGKKVGAFTTAEILHLYQPNSDQWNWAFSQLDTACIAALRDAVQAGKATTATIAALPSVLALAAAPAGM